MAQAVVMEVTVGGPMVFHRVQESCLVGGSQINKDVVEDIDGTPRQQRLTKRSASVGQHQQVTVTVFETTITERTGY